MIKGTYWAAFRNDGQLASAPHSICTGYGAKPGTLYLPVLYKTKRQAKAEGWVNVKKVKLVLVENMEKLK